MTKEKRNTILLWVALIAFLLLFSSCIPRTSDDWYYDKSASGKPLLTAALDMSAEQWRVLDGRLIGNGLAVLTASSRAFRTLFWSAVTGALLALLSALSRERGGNGAWAAVFALLLLFLSPKAWFSGNLAWMPAFNNYITPIALTLGYVVCMRGLFTGAPVRDTVPGCLLCFALGLLSQLFVEGMTVCNLLLAAAFLLWHGMERKTLSKKALLFLLGALLGAAAMASSPGYRAVLVSPTGETYKRAATDLAGMLRMAVQNYRYVAAYTIGANTVPIGCISALGIAIVALRGEKPPHCRALTTALVAVLAGAPVYFYFTTRDTAELLPFATLLRSNGIAMLLDALVYAAYVAALLVLLLRYVDNAFYRRLGCFALLSALACAAPMLFAQPLAHRIFAAEYVFLCLLALGLLQYVLLARPEAARFLRTVTAAAATVVCAIYLCMFCTNPRVERQKLQFIEARMAAGDTVIYTPDFLYGQRLWYPESELWAKYYYEAERDIAFEHIPYDMWLERYYGG